MTVIAHERAAIENLLRAYEANPPEWISCRVAERLTTQRHLYIPIEEHLRFLGISAPAANGASTRHVPVFIPHVRGQAVTLFDAESVYGLCVIVRDPSPEERKACSFGASAIRVAEAVDVISFGSEVVIQKGEPDRTRHEALGLYRPLGFIEYFVSC